MQPICVDLDGTLILTDSLLESFLLLIKLNPLYLFLSLIWILRGRAYFKTAVAARINLSPQHLIYNQALLNWIQIKKSLGHPIYLVSAAHQKIVTSVANYLGIFDGVLASDLHVNLKGSQKALACVKQFGEKNFIYVGNSFTDLPVWQHASEVICVTHSTKLIQRCQHEFKSVVVLARNKPTLLDYLKVIRVHQYAKNILLLVPIFLNKHIFSSALWNTVPMALIAFCLVCSMSYILNDLYDLSADRQHKTKHKRGFASGLIPISAGLYMLAIFGCVAITIQIYLHNWNFSLILAIYFILSLTYSHWLKEIVILDVLVLTLLYTLRIIAGMLLLHEPISNWFLTFSIFFFLSLSLVKRYIELQTLKPNEKILRRGYQPKHTLFVLINGITLGCFSALIFVLYVASSKAQSIYQDSNILYFVAFAIFYWLQRVWLLAIDHKVNEDPVLFAIKDKNTYWVGLVCVMLLLLAHVRVDL